MLPSSKTTPTPTPRLTGPVPPGPRPAQAAPHTHTLSSYKKVAPELGLGANLVEATRQPPRRYGLPPSHFPYIKKGLKIPRRMSPSPDRLPL
jgi:hypothetical protein